MVDTKDNQMNAIWHLIGAVVVAAISWHLFWEVIQPVLVGLSPIFASNPDGYMGRYPDNLTQVALFATTLLVMFVYFCFIFLYLKRLMNS